MDTVGTMPGIVKQDCNSPPCSIDCDDIPCEETENKETQKSSIEKEEELEPDVPDIASHTQGACADFLFVDSMLNHLAKSQQAPFKSQQVGDPDLDFSEKKEIARDILKDNPARFLEKFGNHLLEDHLDYFSTTDKTSENYEIEFHIKRLKRFHSKSKNQVDVRNRRYEALKKLIDGGVYFSENEMKKRNPLMYEQLIGRYLTPQEKEDRLKASAERQSRSYVVHLMGQIEDHYVNCLKKQQQEDEDQEEMDTSDEEDNENEYMPENRHDDIEEFDTSDESEGEDGKSNKIHFCESSNQRKCVSDEEKDLLREEFFNNMYESFLEGNDTDFDYSTVDTNPEYECLAERSQDEEEQYFDSETPELIKSGNITPAEAADNDEEDELDIFMKNLNSANSI